MSKKEIKLHMGFMDENGNLVEIPENIQKHIEAREEFWVDKIKAIDSKCGIVLERLELTEKALKLACEQIWAMSIWENTKEEIIQDNIKFFKDKAKEIMKSE